MKRGIRIAILVSVAVLIALLAASAVLVHTDAFRGWLEGRVAIILSEAAGRPAALQIRELEPLRLRTVVEGLIVEGASPEAPPLVAVETIEIDANWSAVFRRRADLALLKIDGLRVDLEQLPAEWPAADPDAPPLALGDILDLVLIDRLEVTDGWLHFTRADLPLDLLAEEVALAAGLHRLARRYEGELRLGAGRLAVPGQGEFPLDLITAFTFDARAVTITSLEANSAGVALSGRGRLTDLSLPAFEADFEAAATPGEIPAAALADLELEGDLAVEGTVEGRGGEVRVTAEARSERLQLLSVSGEALACELALEGGRLHIGDLEGRVLGARVEGEFAAPLSGLTPFTAELRCSSDDPEPLRQWLFPDARPGATGSYAGSAVVDGTAFDLASLSGTMALEARDLVLPGAPRFPMAVEVAADIAGGAADIGTFTLDGPGTRVEGRGTLALDGPGTLACRVDITRLETLDDGVYAMAAMLDDTLDAEALPQLRGRARLDGELDVPPLNGFDVEAVTGRFDLSADGVALAGAPDTVLDAEVAARLDNSALIIEQGRAAAAGLELEAAGGVSMTGAGGLELRVDAPALQQTLSAVRQLLTELDQPAEWFDPLSSLSGGLLFEARLDGPWRGVDGTAELALDELAADGEPLGRIEAAATAGGGLVEASGTLDGIGGGIGFSGEADLGADGMPGAVEVLFHEQQLGPYLALADFDLPLEGVVDGRVECGFPDTRLQAGLALREGDFAGVAFDVPACDLRLTPGRLEVVAAELLAADGTLGVSGVLEPEGRGDGLVFVGRGFRLESLIEQLGGRPGASGAIGFSGTVSGTLDDPRLAARVELGEMAVDQWSAPDLAGDLTLGRNRFDARLASPDGLSKVDLALGFGEGELWTGEIAYPLHVDAGYWVGDAGAGTTFIVDGDLRATLESAGPDPATLRGTARVDGLRLTSGEYPLEAGGPLELRFTSGEAEILPLRLVGRHTDLEVQGRLDLEETRDTAFSIRGSADLHLLEGLVDRLRSEGRAEIDLAVGGPPDALKAEGTLRLRDGLLGHPEFPLQLKRLEADVDIEPGHWRLGRLEASAGGGTVTGSGELRFDGLTLESHRFELAGRGVRSTFPEGFRSEVDADFLLVREKDGTARLSGEIRVASGLYDEDINLGQPFLTRARAADRIASVESGPLDDVGLDLRLSADEGLWVRNNLASMETRVALSIGGSVGRPDLKGRVEVLDGGTVTFQGVDYNIVRGSIDFPGGPSAEPAVDIRAETARSDYDVRLAITGPLENLEFELSSSPPLPQSDIVTLLVTGKTRDELGSGGGGLSEDEATFYLSGNLAGGIAPALQRSLGLDEVAVNPVLMGSQADPTARITVGKALTPRLFVTYSSLMGSDRQDVYQAKYRFTDRINLLGTRDEDGSLAGDVVYRSRLYLGPERVEDELRADGLEDRRIAGIEFVGNRFASKRQLRRQLGVATREHYHRSRLLAGLEKIRDWYYIRGFPEIDLSHEVIDSGERVRLVITVDEGDRVLISIPGAPRPKRPMLRDLYRLWSRGIFREDLLEEGVRLILDSLRERGFARATVETGRPETAPGTEKVVFTIDRGPRIVVDEIRFTGLEQVTEKEIRRRMLTRKSGLLGRRGFSPETLEEDVEAIRNYYATLGYLDAAVESRVEALREDGTRVAVTIAVAGGARYRLGRVTFVGNEAVGGDVLLAETGLDPGTPFNDQTVRQGERELVAFYDGRGFSGTGVRSDLRIDREAALVDVAYRVEEGQKLVVEEVEVVSPGITNPEVIRRELELWAGDPFSERKADRSQYNLYRTGLFRSVGYEVLPGETPEHRRVVFTVEESPNLHFDYSLGYNSDFGIRVGGNVAHTNFMGRGLYLGLGGRYSGDDSRAQLLLRQPRILGTELEGLVRGYWEQEDRVSFDATRLGGVLQGTRRFRDDRYTLIWGYGLEDLTATEKWLNSALVQPERPGMDPLVDPRLETETRLGWLRLDAGRDTRDNFLWPTSGSYFRAELGVYDELLLSKAEYLRGFVQWSRYQTLFRSTIWTSGVRLGLAQPYGGTEYLPVSERFFTGGDSSLRGFRYDRLPAAGFPDIPGLEEGSRSPGGNALFLFNQELAVPVSDPVHLLFFYDAGNLYWKVSDLDITDLRHAAGLGIRVRTPVGPLRLEYGWKLDREEGESPGRLHFSFGMPF